MLRIRHGDPTFIARSLPAGWFALADRNRLIIWLAARFPAPELLSVSVLRVQAFVELPFVVFAYLLICRWCGPGIYRRAVGLVWLVSVSYTATDRRQSSAFARPIVPAWLYLAALITHAGGSALVFGHSSGGALALEAAARGVAMTKLAVYEPPYIDDGSRPRPAPDLAARITALVAAGHRGEAVEQFFIEGLGMPTDAVAASKADPGWPTWEAYVHTIPYEAAVCNADSMPTDRLAKIQVHTLALVGGASEDWAPAQRAP